ncbi:2Fe-2S iron-sulfur cluster-binding protein [Pseudooceanicola sp. C21-150M6]|uniref:2Fe-2S iron-sulfur cluster-binding protein n=1 Tax=Pseudooceanicola sp. C21-150M6 TaxID=3434355 RepID=UPI003D7F54DB
MPDLYVTTADGAELTLSPQPGTSLMEALVAHDVPGIEAICGGTMACATCHIILDAASYARVGPAPEAELAMLELTDSFAPTSRLSCQITLSEDLDGLRFEVAAED